MCVSMIVRIYSICFGIIILYKAFCNSILFVAFKQVDLFWMEHYCDFHGCVGVHLQEKRMR